MCCLKLSPWATLLKLLSGRAQDTLVTVAAFRIIQHLVYLWDPEFGSSKGPSLGWPKVTVTGVVHFGNPSLRFALVLPTRPSNHDSLLLICIVICIVSPLLFFQIQLPTPECRPPLSSTLHSGPQSWLHLLCHTP